MGGLNLPLRRLALGLMILSLAFSTACRLRQGKQGDGAREIRQGVERTMRARISADGQQLSLRFVLKGSDAHATGTLGKEGTTALIFQPDATAGAVLLGKKPREIPVFSPEVWRTTADTLALRLAPVNPAQGTLILAGSRELIAHRVNGLGKLTPLEQRPSGLKITRRVSAPALADEVFTYRGDALDRPGGKDGPVVLLTGTFPEIAYLDRRARRLTFLSVPPEEEVRMPALAKSGNLAVRQVTSFVWRSNVLALLKNPFSTTGRILASGASIGSAGFGRWLAPFPSQPPPPLANVPEMDLVAWEKELSKIAGSPASAATLRYQVGGDEFFPALMQAIQEARHSIDLQLYIFDNDDYAVRLADVLRQRSLAGVKVRILMDESASVLAANTTAESPMPADFTPPEDIVTYLRTGSNVQVRCMPISGLAASHTKIICVDHKVAWLGGMNIGREYRYDWHDMMIEARGPLVERIHRDFNHAWARHSWTGDLAALRHRLLRPHSHSSIPPPPGTIPVQPLYTSAWHREIVQAQVAALRRCRRRAWLENAYLSDDAFIKELVQARYRGVDVRIIMPSDNDNGVMAANNRAMVPLLRRHGIRVYLMPGMTHIKAAIYDGWACVGSANFDRLSLRVNHEFNIGFSDPSRVEALCARLFETDFQQSREVTGQPQPAPADEMLNTLIRSLAGQL